MNSNDNKTPLEYYERAIQELTNTREQLQTELESLKALKDELKSTQNELATTQAKLDDTQRELSNTKQELQEKTEPFEKLSQKIEARVSYCYSDTQDVKNKMDSVINELAQTKAEFQEKMQATKKELQQKTEPFEKSTRKIEAIEARVNATNADLQKQKEKLYRIESGVFAGSVEKTEGWKGTLTDTKGDNRFIRQYIQFNKAFNHPPKVVVGISYANVSRKANHQLKVKAVDIECKGFFLEIHTWGNTEVFGCDVNWLAYGL